MYEPLTTHDEPVDLNTLRPEAREICLKLRALSADLCKYSAQIHWDERMNEPDVEGEGMDYDAFFEQADDEYDEWRLQNRGRR